MARSIPTTWSPQTLDEIRGRYPITTGQKREFDGHILQLNRCWAYNRAINGAMLDSQTRGLEADLPLLSNIEIARGRIRVWGDTIKLRLWAEGQGVTVLAQVGSVPLNLVAACPAGAIAWTGSGTGQPTGTTIAANQMVDVVIYAQRTVANGNLWRVGIEEVEGDLTTLPDGTDGTGFTGLDTDAMDADTPLDAWIVQTLDLSAAVLGNERPRGMLHLYPNVTNDRKHVLSSVHWRCDGPYSFEAPPGCNRALVDVTAAVRNIFSGGATEEVQFVVLSEAETLTEAIEARGIETIGAGVTDSFTQIVPIREGRGATTRIYIAFRSSIDSATLDTLDIGSYDPTAPHVIYTDEGTSPSFPFTALSVATPPWGVCSVTGRSDVIVNNDPTIKNALPYDTPSSFYDIACNVGQDPSLASNSPVQTQLIISPHPGTGYTDLTQLQPVVDNAASTVQYAGSAELRRCAIADLYGVYIAPLAFGLTADLIAQPQDNVSASLFRRINQRLNDHIAYGTPMLCLRHPGTKNITPTTTLGGSQTIRYEGKYIYASGGTASSAQAATWRVPILSDPNGGASSGAVSTELEFEVDLMVFAQAGVQEDSLAEIEFQATTNGTGGPPSSGTAVSQEFPVRPSKSTDQQQPTEADAALAATADSTDTGSPQDTLAYCYTQEFTWPRQANEQTAPWIQSVRFRAPMPTVFPSDITITATTGDTGDARDINMVIAGCRAWVAPRSE